MACIIFKNFITNRTGEEQYKDYWVSLGVEFRSQVKEAVTTQLASPQAQVRSQVANVVAGIASIEIPRNEWMDLLPTLCTNAEHTE
jgi:importin subunit beta-1